MLFLIVALSVIDFGFSRAHATCIRQTLVAFERPHILEGLICRGIAHLHIAAFVLCAGQIWLLFHNAPYADCV